MPAKKRKLSPTANAVKGNAALRLLSALTARAGIAAYLGKSYGGDRDLYEALGYNSNPTFKDYLARYERQDVARAIIDAPVRACWRRPPRISESEGEETKFETAWMGLAKQKRIFQVLSRLDRLASIGSYAVLLLGFDDGDEFSKPVKAAKRLLYMTPYSEDAATIKMTNTNRKSPRYGLPEQYSLTMKGGGGGTVHWTRVIHVAEDTLGDSVIGTPRLQAVLNRLHDLELIAGGSAEMFWRGALPGLAFSLLPGGQFEPGAKEKFTTEIENYTHGLKRDLLLQGIDVKELAPQVADPSNHVSMELDLIACAVRMPKRILLGSERGELASSEDERAWRERIEERRREHCEAEMLRPLIDRLIEVKVLPAPKEEYGVIWPDMVVPTEKDAAEVAQARSVALRNYVEAIGAEDIVPPKVFHRKFLGFTEEEIEEIEQITAAGDGAGDSDSGETDDT